MAKWIVWATLFFISALFQLFRGIDRIMSYNYSEYTESLNKYAFVGGDAYNYIINANIMTGHFIMASASFIAGILLICTGSIIKALKKQSQNITELQKPLMYNKNNNV